MAATWDAVALRLPPMVLALAKKKAHVQLGYSLADETPLIHHIVSGSLSSLPTILVCILLRRPLPLESPTTDAPPPSLSRPSLKTLVAALVYILRASMGYACYFTVWEACKSPRVATLLQRKLIHSSTIKKTRVKASLVDILMTQLHYFMINYVASMAAGVAYRIGTWPLDSSQETMQKNRWEAWKDKCKVSMKGSFISFCIIQSILLRDRWINIE